MGAWRAGNNGHPRNLGDCGDLSGDFFTRVLEPRSSRAGDTGAEPEWTGTVRRCCEPANPPDTERPCRARRLSFHRPDDREEPEAPSVFSNLWWRGRGTGNHYAGVRWEFPPRAA